MIAQTLLEKKLKNTQSLGVAIQGVPGAFHDIAARHCFEGQSIEIIPAITFDQLVESAQSDTRVDVALMAIENSIAGTPLDILVKDLSGKSLYSQKIISIQAKDLNVFCT